MLFHGHKYVDRAGRSINLLDRTRGLPFLADTVRLFCVKLSRRAKDTLTSVIPRQNTTGTYVYRNGKLVKIGEPISVLDIFQSRHKEYPDQGDREYHNFMYSQDRKGKLNDVDDRVCWEESRRKYGRDKVPVGY